VVVKAMGINYSLPSTKNEVHDADLSHLRCPRINHKIKNTHTHTKTNKIKKTQTKEYNHKKKKKKHNHKYDEERTNKVKINK
jgi:hypothetical protein